MNTGADPRLQPTPDYGDLGPGSDFASLTTGPPPVAAVKKRIVVARCLAIALGLWTAGLAAVLHGGHSGLSSWASLFFPAKSKLALSGDRRALDRMEPQKQAETLLEMAVANSPGAVDQISARAESWQGRVGWNSQISTLTTAALNSEDLRLKQAAVEVELAAYGLGKNASSLHYALTTVGSPDPAQRFWGLWALGLLANRGVESDDAVDALALHLRDDDENSRRWAVEGLALAGTGPSLRLLLNTLRDDPSPLVRERAACAIAQSGLFTSEQRFTAIPQLLAYADDPSLDSQTHAWAFQALGDITHQRLGTDVAAWRSWYAGQAGGLP